MFAPSVFDVTVAYTVIVGSCASLVHASLVHASLVQPVSSMPVSSQNDLSSHFWFYIMAYLVNADSVVSTQSFRSLHVLELLIS
jgi:hypothetical protein